MGAIVIASAGPVHSEVPLGSRRRICKPWELALNQLAFTFHTEHKLYHHIKKLMYTVRVGAPDPRFGAMLLEQFGGANGELAAAMQYSVQGINCEDPARKDLLMDIGTEELSHLEVIGALARRTSSPAARHGPPPRPTP